MHGAKPGRTCKTRIGWVLMKESAVEEECKVGEDEEEETEATGAKPRERGYKLHVRSDIERRAARHSGRVEAGRRAA